MSPPPARHGAPFARRPPLSLVASLALAAACGPAPDQARGTRTDVSQASAASEFDVPFEPVMAPDAYGPLGGIDPESEVLALLPDTQIYSRQFPEQFTAQTQWLVDNADALGIRYVLHLGDLVHNNTDVEWARAASAMEVLDGKLPYALVPGNHDYGPGGDASTREGGLNDYLSYDATASLPTFGGAYEVGKLDNTYHLFSAWGRDFVILALEWGPRDAVLDWANGIMAGHPERLGILLTHAYLNNNDRRYDHTDARHPQDYNPHHYGTEGGVNDGEEIWQKLVRRHAFVLTFNGHVLGDGTGYLVSETDVGTRCHQMLANYQMNALGGAGTLRLLELKPDLQTVQVHTYSVHQDRLLVAPDQRFSFVIDES